MTNLFLATEAAGESVANQVIETTSGAIGLSFLIPLLPLLGFVIIIAVGRRRLGATSALVAIAMSGLSFLLSVGVFLQVAGEQATYLRPMFTWIQAGPFEVTFDLQVDQLTAIMLLVVTGVGTLVHIYSLGYMHDDPDYERFFAYLNLFLFSMLMLVLGSNFLTLFLGWELVGLSSYLLIGFWFADIANATAAKKAFITNRVGDVSFMIAMFLIFSIFGSLSFLEVFPRAAELSPTMATAVVVLLMGGAAAKSAQIPLYVWLPDAMAGPTPVSALIHAATMVTAGVYLMVRSSSFLVQSIDAMTLIAWIGVLTALLAALIAIRQDDIKKILAYSTVSQLGYMFVGVGTGGFDKGIFHLVTHAFFKGLLFLAAGSVMHAMANRTDAWRMGGLRKHLPITHATSLVAVLAISGIFPFAGFWSKDQILSTAYEHGFVGVWILGVVVAAMTAFYMGRWYLLIFWGEPRYGEDIHPRESPSTMTIPLIVLGALSLLGGFVNLTPNGSFTSWLAPVVAPIEGLFPEPGPLGEPALIAISLIAGVTGLALSWLAYGRRTVTSAALSEPVRGTFADIMERRFLVDEGYQAVFVTGGRRFSDGAAWFDRTVIDGAVNGVGTLTSRLAAVTRRAQTGLVRSYIGGLVVGGIVLAAVLLFQVG